MKRLEGGIGARWMIRGDLRQVLAIERLTFEFPWSEDEFVRCLRQRNCIGAVFVCGERVDGYMIYELYKNRLHVLNLAVASPCRRHGIGKALIEVLIGKLTPEGRRRIVAEVRETNLAAQLFFRKQGFKSVAVLRDFYEDTDEDAYVMQYRYRPSRPPVAEAATDEADPCGR